MKKRKPKESNHPWFISRKERNRMKHGSTDDSLDAEFGVAKRSNLFNPSVKKRTA